METAPKRSNALLYACGGFVFTTLLFFHEAVFRGQTFIARDHYLFFLPRRFFAAETLLGGSLPLWNPLNACGVPFLANVQSSVLYPLSALIYVMPFPAGYTAFVIVHYLLAALGMYALLRHWRSSAFAATLAGLVFAFGGYMQSINDNLAFVTAAAWLPLIMLCFSRAVQSGSRRYACGAALLIGMQVLAGDASFCVLTSALCMGLYILCAPRDSTAHTLVKRTMLLCGIWCGALLLAAVILLPFVEFVIHSDRAAGLAPEQALRWSLHPLELLQFIHPYLFGRLVPDVRWFGQRWLDTLYIGIVPLCFTAVYLLRCRCGHKLFLALSALLGLFLALGSYNPLLGFTLQHVPGMRLMQYPVKFMLLGAFSLAIMSGLGFDAFRSALQQRSNIRGLLNPLLLPVCILLALLLAAAVGYEILFAQFCRVYPATDYFLPLRETQFYALYTGVFLAALLFGAYAALTWFGIRFKRARAAVCVLAIVIVLADLYFLGAPDDPWLDRDAVAEPSAIAARLRQDEDVFRIYSLSRIAGGVSYAHTPHMGFDRVYRVLGEALPPNLHLYHGLASVDEYTEMLNVRYYEVFARVLLHLADISDDPDGNRYCRSMFSLLNVRYIISPYALPELGFELVQDGPIRVYRNQDVLPRAFMADAVITCPDDAAVLERLHAPDFEITTVYMPESELHKLPAHQHATLLRNADRGSFKPVSIKGYEANRVHLHADLQQAGLLVLSDTWFPGWVVRINGEAAPLLRVNHTLRGVALEPGMNTVEFIYRPRSFIVGLLLSAAALIGLLLIAASGRHRRRSGAPATQEGIDP